MKKKPIQTLIYEYGNEKEIMSILYQANEPILIKIKNFTNEFSLDYFANNIQAKANYDVFDKGQIVASHSGDFSDVITDIKQGKPYRIFGQFLTKSQTKTIEDNVPLWQSIPFRPRFFIQGIKVAFFFGGKGTNTEMHYDREHCCNLHLCLSGRKQLLLFTKEQSHNIYKLPFIGDSLIDFSNPIAGLVKKFPRLAYAEGYEVTIKQGDMVFLPRNCWHYTRYLEGSASATYVFYPQKILQYYGYFTGYFFLGYKHFSGFKIFSLPLFKSYSLHYAQAHGKIKFLYKLIEAISYFFMLPTVSVLFILSYKLKKNSKVN